MQFDHLMHWVPSLDDAVAQFAAMGVVLTRGGDLGPGTRNAIWPGRDLAYVELIGVFDWDRWRNRPRRHGSAAQDAAASSGGALAFAFEVADVASVVADVRGRGVEIGDPVTGSLRRADGGTHSWHTAAVAEGPGWRPFFIQYPVPRAERLTQYRQRGVALADWVFHRLVLETPDPEAAAEWLAHVLGVQSESSERFPVVRAFGCDVQFVPGSVDRVTRVVLDGAEAVAGHVAGVRYERRV